MTFKSIILIGAACALSVPAQAGDTFEIKPGKWKSDVTMEMSMASKGMAMDQPARTMSHEYCVSAEEAKFAPEDFAKKLNEASEMDDVKCDVSDIQSNHPSLSYTLTCGMDGMDMVMKNKFTIGADGLSGSGTGTSNMEMHGMSVTTKTNIVQTYVGGC